MTQGTTDPGAPGPPPQLADLLDRVIAHRAQAAANDREPDTAATAALLAQFEAAADAIVDEARRQSRLITRRTLLECRRIERLAAGRAATARAVAAAQIRRDADAHRRKIVERASAEVAHITETADAKVAALVEAATALVWEGVTPAPARVSTPRHGDTM